MLRIHVTSDNLTDDELKKWARYNLLCTRVSCPPTTPCDTCAFHNRSGYMVVGGEDTSSTSSLTKESLAKYCSLSKCGCKNSTYDCMFMVNGTCQLDYHCPADLTEEVGTPNG